jgi:muramidase (phage lysozyme)
MKSSVKLAGAGLLCAAAYFFYRSKAASVGTSGVVDFFSNTTNSLVEEAAAFVDSVTGGSLKISAMAKVTAADVQHRNVQAFLRVIRRGEGTSDENGYRRIFGGQLFQSFAKHPNILVVTAKYRSTAAGAYQFLKSTWDETARVMNLLDFSQASQDIGAVGRIAGRGALDDIKAGRFDAALRKCAYEWASLPYSPYGQPVISMALAQATYKNAGGVIA